MKNIGVIANCSKPVAADVLTRLAQTAKNLDLALFTNCEQTAALLPQAMKVVEKELSQHIDVLLALGGDGTMLNAVHVLNGQAIPLAGVNLGSLGFLTSVAEEDLEDLLGALAHDNCIISERTLLECTAGNMGQDPINFRALNDVVCGWGTSNRLISLALRVDGREVNLASCDGIIIATPTGSTGHSLSAGGPIMHPESGVLLINFICPHTLSNRPIVLPDTSEIEIEIQEASKDLILSVDGQDQITIRDGSVISVRKAAQPVQFLNPKDYSYFSVLRQKLHWRGSHV